MYIFYIVYIYHISILSNTILFTNDTTKTHFWGLAMIQQSKISLIGEDCLDVIKEMEKLGHLCSTKSTKTRRGKPPTAWLIQYD